MRLNQALDSRMSRLEAQIAEALLQPIDEPSPTGPATDAASSRARGSRMRSRRLHEHSPIPSPPNSRPMSPGSDPPSCMQTPAFVYLHTPAGILSPPPSAGAPFGSLDGTDARPASGTALLVGRPASAAIPAVGSRRSVTSATKRRSTEVDVRSSSAPFGGQRHDGLTPGQRALGAEPISNRYAGARQAMSVRNARARSVPPTAACMPLFAPPAVHMARLQLPATCCTPVTRSRHLVADYFLAHDSLPDNKMPRRRPPRPSRYRPSPKPAHRAPCHLPFSCPRLRSGIWCGAVYPSQ